MVSNDDYNTAQQSQGQKTSTWQDIEMVDVEAELTLQKDVNIVKTAKEELSKQEQKLSLDNFLPPQYKIWPFKQLLNVHHVTILERFLIYHGVPTAWLKNRKMLPWVFVVFPIGFVIQTILFLAISIGFDYLSGGPLLTLGFAVSPLYLPAGVATMYVTLAGPLCFLPMFAQCLITYFVTLPNGLDAGSNVAWSITKTVLYLMEGFVHVYCLDIDITLLSLKSFFLFFVTSFVFHFVIGSAFVITLIFNGVPFDFLGYLDFAFSWTLGDMAGILIFTFGVFSFVPFVIYYIQLFIVKFISLCKKEWSITQEHVKTCCIVLLKESFFLLLDSVLIAGALLISFLFRNGDNFYITIIPVVLISIRRGIVGSIICVAIINFIILIVLQVLQKSIASILDIQLFMIVCIFAGICLGVSVEEKRKYQSFLEKNRENLEQIVASRTSVLRKNVQEMDVLLRKVAAEEHRMRTLMNWINDALVTTNHHGQILTYNIAFESIIRGKNILALGQNICKYVELSQDDIEQKSEEKISFETVIINIFKDRVPVRMAINNSSYESEQFFTFIIQPLDSNLTSNSSQEYKKTKRESFHKAISDEEALPLFREHCKQEFSEENLDFMLAVEQYKKASNILDRVNIQQAIYKKFIKANAPCQLNLSSETLAYEIAKIDIGYGQMDLFDNLVEEVKVVLLDTFNRFKEKQAEIVRRMSLQSISSSISHMSATSADIKTSTTVRNTSVDVKRE